MAPLRISLFLLGFALDAAAQGFVTTSGSQLVLDGKPFRFAGSNNYFLMYAPQPQVDEILQTAAANQLRVLRTWAWIDIGFEDGRESVAGKPNGVYFQYWTGSEPAYHDENLKRLDYVIHRAGQLGIHLILPFTNNWSDFGGMDQYVRWRGGRFHDDFYTDPKIRGWYQAYIAHLLNRVNSYTGVAYKEDPTILGWELANEPRCGGSGVYPSSRTCSTAVITEWAGAMADFIKSIDSNHLVAAGDEGFYCKGPGNDFTLNCSQGIDTVALASLPSIDWMSFHAYPLAWGKNPSWTTQWIADHFTDAAAIGKPALLGEFGYERGAGRLAAYRSWTDAVVTSQGAGGLFWWLTRQNVYDGFDVACPSAVCLLMQNLGAQLEAGELLDFPPIADDFEAKAEFETPVSLRPFQNVIGTALDLSSVDLDPAAEGQQTSFTANGGTFSVEGAEIRFAPAPGFAGKTAASYTVADAAGRASNPAQLRVTVNPKAGAAFTLFSFETGVEGWEPGFWQSGVGAVAPSKEWASDGIQSLKVTAEKDGWFGTILSPAQSWTGRTRVSYSIKTLDKPTSTALVLKVGASYLWCQGEFSPLPANAETTVTADITKMGCGVPDLSKVQEMYVWFMGGGTYYLDGIRLQ